MANYFSNFPLVQYDMFGDGQTTEAVDLFRIVKVKNSFKDDVTFYNYYDIQDGERPDVVSTRLYGTPDYHWTFFMVNDNLVNVFTDWPLSTADLERAVDKKYAGEVLTTDENISTMFQRNSIIEGLVSGARATITDKDPNVGLLKIEMISGEFVPDEVVRDIISNEFIVITGSAFLKDVAHHYENANNEYVTKSTVGATPISNQEYEFGLNDTKTKIKAIRPQYIQIIADQFIAQIVTEEI